jgi:hypothetical protein
MNIDKNGSYLREPSVSEEALRQRIESLIGDIPLNTRTAVERSVMLTESVDEIALLRSKKELEASLNHRVDNRVMVTMGYNPTWQIFDIQKVQFDLQGTSSITGNLEYDAENDLYSACLYDKENRQQIPREPVRPSTVSGLLATKEGFKSRIQATTQSELLMELFDSIEADTEITIRQQATLFDEEIADDLYGVCWIERTQTVGSQDIVDVIRFVNETHTGDSSHARVISVINSQHGSVLQGEEVNQHHESGNSSRSSIEFDYETIEKLLGHVEKAHQRIRT